MTAVDRYDIVFVGSSPNALAGAGRLAAAGRRVLVVEGRSEVGGPVATEEFAPGFRADTGVMSVALDAEVAEGLGITVDVIERGSVTALGTGVTLRPVDGAVPGMPAAVRNAIDLVRAMHRMAPPSMPVPTAVDEGALGELGARLLGLGGREMHEVLRLLFMSARDYFEETVPGSVERALLCGAAVRAMSEGPFAPGTLFGFLYHEAVGDGLFRRTARGGVGAISRALAERARALGAEIRAGVTEPITIDVEDGIARGVRLAGERIAAGVVVSDADARATFTKLVPPYELEPEENRAIRHGRYRGSVARVHLALKGLPAFEGVDAEVLGGTLVVGRDVASLERAWDQAKRGRLPERPYVEVAIPTIADPSLAPEGKHVLSAWVQWVPPGASREAVTRSVVHALAAFAPALPTLVEHTHVSLPEDLEARFGLTEGHLYGGEVNLAQAFFLRPIPGYRGWQSPIANLYLAGSAAHPGGYSGRSGWGLASELEHQRVGTDETVRP